MVFRRACAGYWPKATSYGELDIVALNGGSFIARQDNPGACPGDGWQLHRPKAKPRQAGEPAASASRRTRASGRQGRARRGAGELADRRRANIVLARYVGWAQGTALNLRKLFEQFHRDNQ